MIRRNDLMLLRIAQADAYAMATEYIKSPRDDAVLAEALKFERYVQHPTHLKVSPGMYSDDTQMSIGISEALLEGPPYTKEKFAEAFVRCFQRDRRDGYSRAFQSFLESVKDTKDFLNRIRPDSVKNGACMRAVPLGVLKDPSEVVEVAAIQAAVTHDTDEGIWSAQMVALMSHFALHTNEEFIWLDSYLRKHMPNRTATKGWIPTYIEHIPWTGRVGSRGGLNVARATVLAVYSLLVDPGRKNLMSILRQVIEWGGDTDSVAAIAWGIASTRMREEVPEFLEWGLEPGRKYGAYFLEDLGRRLMDDFEG